MMGGYRQGFGTKADAKRRADSGTRIMMLIATLILVSGCASQPANPTVQNSIEIESLRLTAAGYYLNLRYRVTDIERANQDLGPGVRLVLVHDDTGAIMTVPVTSKLGAMKQTRAEQRIGNSYSVLFANTIGVGPGSRVTAEIGDMRFENLIIE